MTLNSLPPPGDTGAEIDLREVWGILKRQWWVLVLCTALGVGGAMILLPPPPPVYTASSMIRVQEARGALPGLVELTGGGTRLETEMQVIRSRTVVAAVVDSLQLQLTVEKPAGVMRAELFEQTRIPAVVPAQAYRFVRLSDGRFRVTEVLDSDEVEAGTFAIGQPIELNGSELVLSPGAAQFEEIEVGLRSRERAIDAVLGSLEVTQPARNAEIVQVAYGDSNPELARDVVNTVVDRFLYFRNDAQKAEVRSTIQFLTDQIATITEQLTAAEEELRAFREREYVIDPAVEGSTQVSRLADLQAQRSAIEAERVALERLVAEIEDAARQVDPRSGVASPYRRLAAFPALMRSGAIEDVLRQLTDLENERASLLVRRRPEDQDVLVLSARIEELEEQLRSFVSTYLAGLSGQVASIDASLAQFGDQLARLPANEVEFARLSRQPRLLAEMQALLQTRLQEAQVAQAVEDASVQIIDPAVTPTRADPATGWMLKFGAVSFLGLLLGLTVGFVREYADGSVYSRTDVQTAIGVPVLGLVPRVKGRSRFALKGAGTPRLSAGRSPLPAEVGSANGGGTKLTVRRDIDPASPLALLVDTSGPNPVSDAYDRLYSNVLFALGDREPKVLLLTSALPGDGKTTTATNLALALARRGLRTLVIDADLRRGRVAEVFGGNSKPGLTEVLNGSVPVGAAIQTFRLDDEIGLRYIATGTFPAHPASVIGSAHMKRLLEGLRGHFDRIIIDSPPLNIVADAALLADSTDGVLMVARAGVTPQAALTLAAEQLRQARIDVVGAVLNDIDYDRHGSYDAAYKSYSYGRKYYAGAQG